MRSFSTPIRYLSFLKRCHPPLEYGTCAVVPRYERNSSDISAGLERLKKQSGLRVSPRHAPNSLKVRYGLSRRCRNLLGKVTNQPESISRIELFGYSQKTPIIVSREHVKLIPRVSTAPHNKKASAILRHEVKAPIACLAEGCRLTGTFSDP